MHSRQETTQRYRNPFIRIAVCCVLFASGCRQTAYNELYIEQMNTENRLLEDRIYEYDSAYRELELEAETLYLENDRLRDELESAQTNRNRLPLSPSKPNPSKPNAKSREAIPPPTTPPMNISPADGDSKSNKVPLKDDEAAPLSKPSTIESEMLEPPSIEFETPPSALNSSDSDEDTSLELASYQEEIGPDADKTSAAIESATLEQSDGASTNESMESNDSINRLLPIDLEGNLEDSKAYVPKTLHTSNTTQTDASVDLAQVDETIVELRFHPAFTRTLDIDRLPGEECVRMVVQPMTAQGRIVEADGEFTIVVVDNSKASASTQQVGSAKVGRWSFPADRLPEFFEPIGMAQGYRFELGPMEISKTATELTVFVRLEFEDGRKIVNQYTLHANTNPADKPVWTAIPK